MRCGNLYARIKKNNASCLSLYEADRSGRGTGTNPVIVLALIDGPRSGDRIGPREMDFFDEWYSPENDYYDENDEKKKERALASMLQAAADTPTHWLRDIPEAYPNSVSNSSDFINRIVANNTIPQFVNKGIADINSWFQDLPDLPTRDQSEYDFLRKPTEPLDDLGFFDRKDPAQLFREMAGSTGPDDDFWEPQPANSDLADIDSWFEEPNDLPGKDWSLKEFLRKPEEPLGDLGFFVPDQEVGNEQPGISQLQNWIQYDQDTQMNSAEDIAQQQTDMDNAWSDYQPAVDEYSAYYDSEEPEPDWQDGAFDNPEEDEEWDWDGEPDVYDKGDGSGQETQDSKKPDAAEPDRLEQLKQRFLDQLTVRGHSQEDALEEWQNLVNSRDKKEIGIITSQLEGSPSVDLDHAKMMADLDKRMRTATDAGATALAIAGLVQVARFGLRYALSKAAGPEAAGERGLASRAAGMERPYVRDGDLSNLLDQLYRPNARIGSGGTADAVRYELGTGGLVEGRSHIQ